jgi:predicted Ser/Thr protein kinase
MSQDLLSIVPDVTPSDEPSVEKSTKDVYRLTRDSIELVGGADSAAKIMGVDRGDLRRALDRSGRYLAIDHLQEFGARLVQYSPETAQRIATAMVRPFDMLVYPRVQITAAERARRLENLLRSMPLGAELVRKALETP